MTGMPFNLQGKKGVFELAEISSFSSLVEKWKKEGSGGFGSSEPTSVLDTGKSPSPPTSTSTLSSSLGGSSGSNDTAGVAAVSDNPPQKWPPTQEDSSAAVADPPSSGTSGGATGGGGGGNRKDEWASELQPIPTALEIINGTAGATTAAEKCGGGGGGLGMEDWETMWPETAASPSQEQSLLRWIMGDGEDPSSGLKQFLQGVGPSEFEANAGFGIVDSGSGLEALGNSTGSSASSLNNASLSANTSVSPSLAAVPASTPGFLPNNGRIVPNSIPNHPNHSKIVPVLGSNNSCITTTSSNSNNPSNPIFSSPSNNLPLNLPLPISLSSGVFYQQQPQQQQFELAEEKPQLLNPHLLINHQQNQPNTQNPALFVPLSYTQQDQHLLPPQPKRHHPGVIDPSYQISKAPFPDSGQEFYLRRHHQQQQQGGFPPQQLQLLPNHLQPRPIMATKPKLVSPGDEVLAQHHHQQQQQQHQQQQNALLDQLVKAAELVESGNSVLARGILARLNHQLSPVGKPLLRAAFYFKEALLLLTNNNAATSPPQRISTPFDVFLKIGSYKAFSETSPIVQFANFTCNQVLLEALEGFSSIRIIDFDLGLGGQWASFMQEISLRMGGAPSLKITAITSPSSHDHPLELVLAKDNLSHFASDLGISFSIEILNLDSYDPASWSLALNVSEGEAVAVNLPASPSSYHPSSFPSILRLVKQLSPKIVVSVERGCDRSDLTFLQHFLYSLNSYSVLLDSLDAVSTNPDTVNKIERFLLQPRIDSAVLRGHCLPEKVPPCRTLFASTAFSPFPFSNFTETQAEWLVKRLRVRGFHVEKRQNSLDLCWQMQDLVSVSAWTC